jgi:putative sterol carrier protein
MPKFYSMTNLIENLSQEFRPGNAVNERATIQLDLTGAEAGRYWVRIDNGSCICGTGDAPQSPDVTLLASTEDWLRIINDELMSITAFLQGKLKVQGNKAVAIKIQRWFED